MGCFASKYKAIDDDDDEVTKPTEKATGDSSPTRSGAGGESSAKLLDEIKDRVAGIREKAQEYRNDLQAQVIQIEQEKADKGGDEKAQVNGVVIVSYTPEEGLTGTKLLEANHGDRVEIIVRDTGGWAYCRLEESSKMGWLPSSRVAEIARVIADHSGDSHQGLLSVKADEYVEVVNRHYSGWALCREWKGPTLPGTTPPKEGWVTDSYLEDKRSEVMLASKWHRLVLQALDQVVASSLDLEAVLTQAKLEGCGELTMEWMGQCLDFTRWLTTELQSITQAVSQRDTGLTSGCHAIVQWDTSPGTEAELEVSADARVLVVDAENADWVWCLIESSGKEGWVPRNVLQADGDAERPDDGPKFTFEDLPTWVREGTQARWWSTSGKRFCDVIISKVDVDLRDVTVVFVVDKNCWKSVNFDHFAQPPDDWLLQPEESKALELRNQLPAWIEVGATGYWWSTSQQRVHTVKVREVCTRRRAVLVSFDIDSSVRKSVPFHQLIDDPDASFLQRREKDHAWRLKRKLKKKKKAKKNKHKGKTGEEEAKDAMTTMILDDDLADTEVDELDAFIHDDDDCSSSDSAEELKQTFAKTSKEQLSNIFDDMQQDLGHMLGGPDAISDSSQDVWPSGGPRKPTKQDEAPQLRTLADAVMDAQATPPDVGRSPPDGLEAFKVDDGRHEPMGDRVARTNAAQPTPSRPAAFDHEHGGALEVPSFGRGGGEGSKPEVVRHDMSFSLEDLKQELMDITTEEPMATRASGPRGGGDEGFGTNEASGGAAVEAGGAPFSVKASTGDADSAPVAAGTSAALTADVSDSPPRQTSKRSPASGGGGRPGSKPSVCSGAGSTVGELRAPAPAFNPDAVATPSPSRGSSIGPLRRPYFDGASTHKSRGQAPDDEYTQSEQGLMDQLEGISVQSEHEGGGLFNTLERGLLEELGSPFPSPMANAKAKRKLLEEAAAAADGGDGRSLQLRLARQERATANEGEPAADVAPAPTQLAGSGECARGDAGDGAVEPGDAGTASTETRAAGQGADDDAVLSPPKLPLQPPRHAAATAWGDVGASAAAAPPKEGGDEAGGRRPDSAETAGGEAMVGATESTDEAVAEDLRESMAAFGVEGASSSLLSEAMRAVMPETWDSEGQGRLRKPPDVRHLAEAWPQLEPDLTEAAAKRMQKLHAALEQEIELEEAKVDAKVQEVGQRLEQRAKGAEAKLDPGGAQKYRSMQWTVMNAGETFKESLRKFQSAKAALRAEKGKCQKACLRKALLDPSGAVVSAFMPNATHMDDLRPAVAVDEVAEALRELFRSVEVAAVRPQTSSVDGRAEFLAGSYSTVATTPFEMAGQVAIQSVSKTVDELKAKLRREQETMPAKDDMIEDLQWDGLSKEEKRDKKLFDGQQEFDWDRAVEKAVEARSKKRKSMFQEKLQRAERILRNRWRKTRDRDKQATLEGLAAFGAAINEVEDKIRHEYRESAERAEAEVASMEEERRATHQQTQVMLSAALVVREEKETMNAAWYAPPKERQATMLKCLRRVRRLQEDMKGLETVADLKQKHSVLLYSLRMLEAKLMGECQATMRDIQEGPLKLNAAQKKHLEDDTRLFEEKLADDIDRVRASHAVRAERAVSRLAAEFRRTAIQQHEPSLEAARLAIDASTAAAARAELAAVALRALGDVAAKLSAEAVRHSEVSKSPLDVPGFLPKRKRLADATNTTLKILGQLQKELDRPLEQLASGIRAAPDREWESALCAAEKRWREFCQTYPERELEDGNETPRSDAEVVQGRNPFKAYGELDLGDLGEDDTPHGSGGSRPLSPSSPIGVASPFGGGQGRWGSGQASPQKAALRGKAQARARGSSPKGQRPDRPPSAAPINRPPSAGGNGGQRRTAFGEAPPAKGSDIGAPPARRRSGSGGGGGGQGAELLAQLDDLSRNLDRALGGKTKTKTSGANNTPAAPPRRGSLGDTRSSLGGGPPPARRG
mmetsp:Transcript_120221/g.345573  ORF Transcript_120221/g.345573 Transcript_120221/m.345573 type:complete len:1962 (-) Transcript_120221:88-5973(-)